MEAARLLLGVHSSRPPPINQTPLSFPVCINLALTCSFPPSFEELGRTVRTTEEERLITETRRVVHHGPGAVQITEIPAEFTAASGGSQHEELSEHVEEMEVVGERQNNEASVS